MTSAEAEQAVIAAAIEWNRDEYVRGGERGLAAAVDALLALRLSDAGGEAWKPKPGDLVKFKGSTYIRKVIEYLASSTHDLLVESVGGNGYIYASVAELEPVTEQAKAEARPHCWCSACGGDMVGGDPFTRIMVLCPKCGNKRCPKAAFHGNKCTRSNDLNQVAQPEESANG